MEFLNILIHHVILFTCLMIVIPFYDVDCLHLGYMRQDYKKYQLNIRKGSEITIKIYLRNNNTDLLIQSLKKNYSKTDYLIRSSTKPHSSHSTYINLTLIQEVSDISFKCSGSFKPKSIVEFYASKNNKVFTKSPPSPSQVPGLIETYLVGLRYGLREEIFKS